MGNRGNIIIKDTGVALYTHWKGTEIPERLANALDRGRERWKDPEYLARIIFDDLKGDDVESLTGFGIGTVSSGEREFLLNVEERTIDVGGTYKFLDIHGQSFTFEEFINEFA